MKEIGSEFWGTEQKVSDVRFFLSGRTALEFIIRDILSYKKIKSVLMPSYCCETMIEPFCRHGLQIRFYDVFYDAGQFYVELPLPRRNEIFFVMNYFGYSTPMVSYKEVSEYWDCTIEDCTHTCLLCHKNMFGGVNLTIVLLAIANGVAWLESHLQ